MTELLASARGEAIRLLRANLGPHGLAAASPGPQAAERRYTAIFARDAGVCALGMALSGDAPLLEGARTSLRTLGAHQADNGQIPKYVQPEAADSDFWYVGCIDATLWWLIALRQLEILGHPPEHDLRPRMERALQWLQCQEHPRLCLVQQNEASDWADIMPRSGFVLYSNALWYYVKRLYDLPRQEETAYHFNHLFFPFTAHVPEYRRLRLLQDYVRAGEVQRDLYLSFVNFAVWGGEGDVFGNLLALLVGPVAAERRGRILDRLVEVGVADPYPVRVTCEPIGRDSALWRTYMERHAQNLEWQYHNGGVWPFVGGFWVMALAADGRRQAAEQALHSLARANASGDWGFQEWFHGDNLRPGGMRGQSWNAAMFLLAQEHLAEVELPGLNR